MARRGYSELTPARREKLVNEIVDFFDAFGVAHKHWRIIDDWCGTFEVDGYSYCLTDEVRGAFERYESHFDRREEAWGGKFLTQITCCISAGFSAAVEANGGVIGFDIGDIKRMYPRGLPGWLVQEYEGIEKEPDDRPIWL